MRPWNFWTSLNGKIYFKDISQLINLRMKQQQETKEQALLDQEYYSIKAFLAENFCGHFCHLHFWPLQKKADMKICWFSLFYLEETLFSTSFTRFVFFHSSHRVRKNVWKSSHVVELNQGPINSFWHWQRVENWGLVKDNLKLAVVNCQVSKGKNEFEIINRKEKGFLSKLQLFSVWWKSENKSSNHWAKKFLRRSAAKNSKMFASRPANKPEMNKD